MILMDLFEEVLHLSVYGTVAGAGVWLLSLLIGRVRAPKWIALVLWGILAFRLVIPFSFSSKMSVYQIGDLDMRIENTLSLDRIYAEGAQNLQMGTVESPKAFEEGISFEDLYPQTALAQAPDRTLWELVYFGLSVLWIAGVLLLWLWGEFSYISLKHRLRFAIRCEDSIYETDGISSPCVAGIFAPRVYLTPGLSGKQREYIIMHERMHIRYFDYIWKILSFLIISLHWFNPCLWLLWSYFQRELENACDERVIRRIGEENKEDYSQSLLAMVCMKSRDKGWKMSVPIAFGEDDTKGRIQRILKYRKPLVTVSVLMIVLGAGVCGVLFTMPSRDSMQPDGLENVYDEYFDGNFTYQSREDGIYRVRQGKEERIYDGYVGADPQMAVFEGRLYFLVDKLYTDGALDWAANAVRWVDLQTFEVGNLVLEREGALIDWYRVNDGVLTVVYFSPEGSESTMLYHEGETVMNGKMITELSDQEARQFGAEMTDFILENKGTLVNISNRVPNQNIAYLDMDGDGSVEKIILEPAEGENEADWALEFYCLRMGEAAIEGFGYSLANTLWAWSPDGEEIFLILYEDGPSADPYSHFFYYQNGNIVEAGGFEADIRNCVFHPDGTVSGGISKEIIQTDWIEVHWQIGDDGMLEEIPQEIYEFVSGNEIELLTELPLHLEIGAEETTVVKAQMVKALRISADFNWILIETQSGEQGWVHIENYEVPELGRNVMEVFEGRYLAG